MYLAFVASHSCTVECKLSNTQQAIYKRNSNKNQLYKITNCVLLIVVPNVKVSDTTGDAISTSVGLIK